MQGLKQRLPKMGKGRILRRPSDLPRKISPEDAEKYAEYVEKGLVRKNGDVVSVSTPEKKTDLKLITVGTDRVKFHEKNPADLEARTKYFIDQIRQGKTIPPILVHRLPSGRLEVIDGHARLNAYRRLGIKRIPAVENSISEALGKIGKGIASAVKTGVRVGKQAYEKVGKPMAKEAVKVAKAGVRTVGEMKKEFKEASGEKEPEDKTEKMRNLARKGYKPAQNWLFAKGEEW